MSEELPTTTSRNPPPLPPNHPNAKKSSTTRPPPPPKPPQMSHHHTPPPPPSRNTISKQTSPNSAVTVISAQPITQAHPFHLSSRPVSENHDETTLPPRAKAPPITSKPVPPKPQNYVNLEIPAVEPNETDINHPVRPSQPPVSTKTDDKLPHRPTSPPSDIFLSNILVKEAGDKQTNKLTPTRNPPPPRPTRTTVSETADSENKPPEMPPPVTTRKLSVRKAPPPPVANKAVYPADSDETTAQPEATKTAEPPTIKPTPRRIVAPPVKQDSSPSKPPAPAKPASPAHKIDKPSVPPLSKPTRPGNPKPSKPTGPPVKRAEPNQDPNRRAPSLPPRPGPGHPLYKYVCQEPHGFALIHFPTNQPDLLSITKGEFLMLIERLDENWYYCANEGDEEGIVLANNIKVVRKLPDEGGQIISADKPFAVAIHNYSSSVDGDLSFKKGDVIFLVRYLSETWLEGELEGTKVIGMFPKSQVEIVTDLEEGPPLPEDTMVGPRAKVVFDFPGDQAGDLPLFKDGFVCLLEKLEGGWYRGALPDGSEEGIFPEGFIEVVEALPDVPTPEPVKQPEPVKPEPVKPEPAPVVDQGYTGKAIYDFEGGTDGDLSFHVGDVITDITSVNTEWLQGMCNGLSGIFPVGFTEEVTTQASPVKKKSAKLFEEFMPRANALFDYNENVSGDLCFKAGDVICLLKKLNEEWYEGELNGVVGNLPASFVEVVVPLP